MLTEIGKALSDKGFDHVVGMFKDSKEPPVLGFSKDGKMTHYRVERVDKINRKVWAQRTTLYMEDEVDIIDKPKKKKKK